MARSRGRTKNRDVAKTSGHNGTRRSPRSVSVENPVHVTHVARVTGVLLCYYLDAVTGTLLPHHRCERSVGGSKVAAAVPPPPPRRTRRRFRGVITPPPPPRPLRVARPEKVRPSVRRAVSCVCRDASSGRARAGRPPPGTHALTPEPAVTRAETFRRFFPFFFCEIRRPHVSRVIRNANRARRAYVTGKVQNTIGVHTTRAM